MFINAYKNALAVLARKPFVLWGLSLMSGLLTILASLFFGIIPAIGVAVSYLLTCGMAKVYLDGLMGKPVYSDQLFAGFNSGCMRIIGGMAWSSLWVLIWGLVPIVGPIIAIVKAYSYRFVPYILVSCPEVSATQALRISKEQTQGLKGTMFLADFCFGLAVFVIVLVLALFAAIPIIGVLFGLVLFIFVVLLVALSPIFQGLYQAYFYAAKDSIRRVYQEPAPMINTFEQNV